MRSCIKKMIHIAIVYQKNDTYCNMYQNMYYIFCTWYNMYQKMIHEIIHGWIDPIKTILKTIHQMIHGAKF